jgi:DNA-binding NtrC family response regulator
MTRGSISDDVFQGSTITSAARKTEGDHTVLHGPVMHLYSILNCECLDAGASRYNLDSIHGVKLGRGDRAGSTRNEDASELSVQLVDGSVSREHARLFVQDGAWVVQDLGSKNGTWVNGRRVDGSTPVAPGAIIEVGNTFLTLRLSTAPQLADAVNVRAESRPRGLVTMIPELVDVFQRLDVFAGSNRGQVSILGESGVGKEVLARAYHELTDRPGAFNAVNCAALPDGLVETELFGHRKGAYSGASSDSLGLVRAADGGTLFLDEIGDLPLLAQAKLLRVLEAREVMPVGASKAVPVDVRVVCATHRNLTEMVAKGTFRHDLLARLKDFVLELPPLRERTEDIGLLVSTAIGELAGGKAKRIRLSASAARLILMHRWPENIRELKRDIQRAIPYAKDDTIDAADLPADRAAPRMSARPRTPPHGSLAPEPLMPPIPDPPPPGLDVHDLQLRAKVVRLLHENFGNVTKVANLLGKNRSHMHEVLKKLSVDPEKYRRRHRSFD